MSQILTTKKFPNIIFINSPCVVTMKSWGADHSVESTSLAGLGIEKNCDVVVIDGIVKEIGKNLLKKYEHIQNLHSIDAQQLVLMPDMLDCHTHPIYAGNRAKETVMKSQGVTYEEIAMQGGGILASMHATRRATEQELTAAFKENATRALHNGVVVMESKTGYGLNVANERKMLNALFAAYDDDFEQGNTPLPKLAPTYLGPHAPSPDFSTLDNYIEALIEDLPNISKAAALATKKGFSTPLAVDIFIERNYFTKDHGVRWLGAALQHGLDIHIHCDEFSRSGGSTLALELARKVEQTATSRRATGRVLSIDHCQYSTESDLIRLAELGVSAVALPSTSFFSRIPYVDAKKWRSSGINVAIASDFNPGSAPINNLWFSCYLALAYCGFSLSEVYAGVTINAAYALGLEKTYGKIEEGKKASIVAFSGESVEDFFSSPIGEHVKHVVL